jgi:hypothetical protein
MKSAVELGHMRAHRAHQPGRLSWRLLRQVRRGTTKDEIEQMFMVRRPRSAARRRVWLATGTIGGLTQGKVVEGEPMMVDAVSPAELLPRGLRPHRGARRALEGPRGVHGSRCASGSEVVLEKARPGMKYSELRALVADAMAKAYTGSHRRSASWPGPHSVGLQHTDQPYRDGRAVRGGQPTSTLEEGMTLTVDLPTSLLGWGAIHHEDLLVVTRQGRRAAGRRLMGR